MSPAARLGPGAALLLLSIAGFALRAASPAADPPVTLSLSNAEVMDGPWYLAEAADRARGLPPQIPAQYKRPLFTALMTIAFRDGVSLEKAHVAVAAASSLVIPLAFGAARAAFGVRAGLFAALLLALGFVPVGYGRTTVVYGPLAAGVAGVLWLHVSGLRREPGRSGPLLLTLAWLLLCALAVGLQPVVLALAPALAAGQLAATRRLGPALALLALGGLLLHVADPQLLPSTAAKAMGYFGAAAPLAVLKRWLRASFASGLWPRAPLILGLGFLGVLAALRPDAPGARGERGERRAVESALAAALVGWVGVFSFFQYLEGGPPPLRYFVPALVPAAILAAGALERLLAGGLVVAAPAPALFAWGTLVTYWALGTIWTWTWRVLVPEGATAPGWLTELVSFRSLIVPALACGSLLAHALRPPGGRRLVLAPRAVAALLLGGLLIDAPFLYFMLARPAWSLRDANRAVARLVTPGGRIFGPWAHALTYDAERVERRAEVLDLRTPEGRFAVRDHRCTHLAIDARDAARVEEAYARAGSPLLPLLELGIRWDRVNLYRFPWAQSLGYRLSAAEAALERSKNPP